MDLMQSQLQSVMEAIRTLAAGNSFSSFSSRPPRAGVGFGGEGPSMNVDLPDSQGSHIAAAVVESAQRVEAHVPNVLVTEPQNPEST